MEGGLRNLARAVGPRRSVRRFCMLAGAALYPHSCVVCGKEGRVLCEAHGTMVTRPMRGVFVCPGCGKDSVGGRRCGRRACDNTPLEAVAALSGYAASPLGALLRLWKYSGSAEARDVLLDALRRQLALLSPFYEGFFESAVLVPVPAGRLHVAVRGFDQAAVIAEVIGRASGRPVAQVLRRSFGNKRQAELKGHGPRRRNVERAFGVMAGASVPDRVVLIDDVRTSGATLDVCASALKAAGAVSVRAFTLLRG